jgi:hypothetical protein
MTSPETPATPGPAGRSTRRSSPDPLAMTAEEKAMCEWEARHDVAARGSRATPGSVQLYLAGSRSRERCEEAARPRPEPRRAAAAGPPPVPPSTEELWFRLAPPEHRPRRTRRTER